MEAAVGFAGKLARRYRPGGALATEKGWGPRYGVRAWELDNEPESYFTHWEGQAGDYAEFLTRASAAIRAEDPLAVILAPAMASGARGLAWLEQTLDAHGLHGSAAYRQQARPYSLGPATDVISFHSYEGLDTALAGTDRTIEHIFKDLRRVVERWERRSPGFEYARKQDYWHTEGSFDFLGIMSRPRRAAWRWQFFTRAFAAGIRKVAVMDASPEEQIAVRAYVAALPQPFPMRRVTNEVETLQGQSLVFFHPDGDPAQAGGVWVAWAAPGAGNAVVNVPVRHPPVKVVRVGATEQILDPAGGRLRLELPGDRDMAPPALVIDRPSR
jgi:hypothetical protein